MFVKRCLSDYFLFCALYFDFDVIPINKESPDFFVWSLPRCANNTLTVGLFWVGVFNQE